MTLKQELVPVSTPAKNEHVLSIDVDSILEGEQSDFRHETLTLGRNIDLKITQTDSARRDAFEQIKNEIAAKNPELGRIIGDLYRDNSGK